MPSTLYFIIAMVLDIMTIYANAATTTTDGSDDGGMSSVGPVSARVGLTLFYQRWDMYTHYGSKVLNDGAAPRTQKKTIECTIPVDATRLSL
ncbi:hypothetical protein OH76DRAFT_309031 [Lentinus brumalis]|uniref:Uncharacterized protein n=1 Tax=Lentinus brumalis TaxID=2498619 RepID=A0A371CKB2_9APHY|nr:hypothetical protein OH76DRAFT_309031 [Polyporus brumalis]